MNTNVPSPTDEDWSWLEQAVGGRPATTPTTAPPPKPAQPPASEEPPLRVMTADEIMQEADEQQEARKSSVSETRGKHAAPEGVVYADMLPSKPAPKPTIPSTSNSPELVELLRGIYAELKAIGAMLPVAINKMPSRK
jgi:hypothetical protein